LEMIWNVLNFRLEVNWIRIDEDRWMKNEFLNTDWIEFVVVSISKDLWRNFGHSPLWRNSKCKTKTTFESIHNKLQLNDSNWITLFCCDNASFLKLFQILAILIENNILKSRLIFRFSLSGGKKKLRKQFKWNISKSNPFFLIMKKGTHNVHSKVQWFSFL
jgi:hypothetical protein